MLVRCITCDKEFRAKPYEVKVRGKKFCSQYCYGIKAKLIKNTGRFVKGHKKQGLASENSNWKGNKVGYSALHSWIKSRLDRPLLCQKCNDKPAMDLANKSNKYLRDLSDWWWLCRKCHMESDGRMEVFLSYANTGKKGKENGNYKDGKRCKK